MMKTKKKNYEFYELKNLTNSVPTKTLPRELYQESLTKGEGSVQLTSLYKLV